MGAPSALPLLMLFACCWAPGEANLSQDDSQPWTSDETVVAGGTVVLKCQVKDHEDSSLQWSNPAQQTLYFGEKRGEPTRIQEDPNGKTFTVSSSVTFQVTREDDGADIICSVSHESLNGADRSTSQRIEVLYKPTAKIRPDPPHPREGQKLLLHCEGRGNPIPQQYEWEKEGSALPLKIIQESALIFPFLNKSDSGTYGCTATSNMGSYKAYYTLNVNDHSPVPSSSSTYHAIIGGIVAFIVFLLLILLIFLGHYLIRHKEPTDKAHPGSWEKQLTSWDTAKDYHQGTSGGIQVIVFQGKTDDHSTLGIANCPGQEYCRIFYLIFPKLQNPSLHLVYSLL
ncbi:hypothetical protein HJG60_001984 [Phyllostomus discolor]|uniref:Ig-like domain-containing protein n=1 Tax=Phyllostomus discolor TaxID=89673 RepID=A0A833YIY8_9CHIR|nr:hypothetical protein HJG60_001984 [Phyllostomus discolor]